MSIQTNLKALAGIAALAVSGAAFANTTGDASGTIILNIVDTSNTTSFLLDTGILVSSFTGTGSLSSINVASLGGTNFSNFLAGEGTGDVLTWSVVGSDFPPASTTAQAVMTSAGTPSATTGAQVASAAGAVVNFLAANPNNPSSGSTYFLSSQNTQWSNGGFEGNLGAGSAAAASDNSVVTTSSSMAFYNLTTSKPTKTTQGTGTTAAFAGTWTLTATGANGAGAALAYSVAAVPLPTPLLLLFSGLGLMGAVARRSRSA